MPHFNLKLHLTQKKTDKRKRDRTNKKRELKQRITKKIVQ